MRGGPGVCILLCGLFAASVLAGCNGPPPAEAGDPGEGAGFTGPMTPLLEDPLGDAYVNNDYWLAGMAPCVKQNAVSVPPEVPLPPEASPPPYTCQLAGLMWTLPVPDEVPVPRGAIPAHPARDILGFRMQETAQTLEVWLDLAELREDFAGARDGGSPESGTFYYVDWIDPASGCYVRTQFDVVPLVNGLGTDSYMRTDCFHVFQAGATPAGPCRFSFCWWDVPFAIEFGAPATLHWSVPRANLAASGQGLAAEAPLAASGIPPTEWNGMSATGPVELITYRTPDQAPAYSVDDTAEGTNFTFSAAASPAAPATLPVRLSSVIARPPAQAPRPDVQILGTSFEEVDDRFRATVELALVEETPANHTLVVQFSLPGHDLYIGYDAAGGVRTPYASLAKPDGSQSTFPLQMDIEPGAPGRVVLEFARADVPPVPAGGVVTGLWAGTFLVAYDTVPLGNETLQVGSWQIGDYTSNPPAVALTPDDDPDRAPPAGRFSDEVYDARPPNDLLLTPTAQFDLAVLEVTSTVPGEVRISLGVLDLAQLSQPVVGYDDVFFAVGIETSDGSQTMVGYYRGQDRPTGAWLCAPDTTVLAATPADPVTSDWLPILGRVVEGSSGGRGGAGGAGDSALLMFVPAECFGVDERQPSFEITRIEAGSYLIRRGANTPGGQSPGQSVVEVDAMEPEGGFVLTFATIAEEPPSFWDEPFGLEQFWNIFGATLAILTVVGTFLVFLRRRNVMKGYIADIVRLEKTHLGEPVARAAALVALRRRLHRDIVSHRVSDSSYILDRMRSSITSARLVTLGESFYDLPTALALRIERLLDDGRLSAEEQSMLEPLVGRAKMPPEDRERLIQRLQRWVAEDAGVES